MAFVSDRCYAHTPNEAGDWDLLAAHSRRVADQASANASAFDAAGIAEWLGLHHDAGKASEGFQAYLKLCATEPTKRHQSLDHKGAGAVRALSTYDVLALLVQGHHGGIPDMGVFKSTKMHEFRKEPRKGQLAETLRRFDALDLVVTGNPHPPKFAETSPLALEFFLRMLFSALVDADHGDTERHFSPDSSAERGSIHSLEHLWERLSTDQSALEAAAAPSAVNDVRRQVYKSCLRAAELQPGFFRLTVPTGGGKTRSGLAFALKHAIRWEMRRVIVAVPFLTITDQTAQVFRDALGDDRAVLEHHSGAGEHNDPDGLASPNEVWRRLSAQDWNAPVIVTTTVQLFQSLASNNPARCRKLHRISGSVIILDEAQTLPTNLRTPIFDLLRELVANYRVSVVFCTATQPAFEALSELPESVREIVPEPEAMFRTLERVTYEWPARDEQWTWERVGEEMRTSTQSLTIVNTVADALSLLFALDDPDAFHLSTLLCGAHRQDVLAEVRRRLKAAESCRLVSTQVVEAGVDIDFPLVLRALGPLDRIVQAGGRANREGRLHRGRVVVFNPVEGGLPPGAYHTFTDETRLMLNSGDIDLNNPITFPNYFARVNQMLPGDRENIQSERARLAFDQVAEKFKMIPDDTVSVLVRYRGLNQRGIVSLVNHDTIVNKILGDFKKASFGGMSGSPRALLRRAQPYLVSVRKSRLQSYLSQGLAVELLDGVYEWKGEYDVVAGLNAKRIDPDVLYLGE